MRRFFIFLFIFFASLFFSQCKIGKISFAIEDVLTFFTNGKVEGKDKNNKIQQINGIKLEAAKKPVNIIQMVDQMIVLKEPRPENIHQFTKELTILEQEKPENIVESIDEIVINADEKPETKIQGIDEIKLEADERPENEIKIVEQMTVLRKSRQENVVQNTKELIILKQKKPENIIVSIDKIGIKADEKPGNEFQHIDKIVIKAKEREQNILQNIQEISILAKQRHENEIQQIESIELLEIERPQIKPELIDEIYLHDVVKPENKIEGKDNFLIEGKKKEDLQIVTVNNLLFSKKEQQKKTNELYNAGNFEILCAKKKNQNSICRTEPFEIVTVIPRKFRAQVLSSISNEKFSFSPEVKTNKNNRIIKVENFKIISEGAVKILEEKKEMEDELKNLDEDEEYIKRLLNSINGDEQNGENQNTIERKENFQIKGKESAGVIKLQKKADEMHKALQEYEKRHNEVLKVIHEDWMDKIFQIENQEEAISEISKIVKKKMNEEGKIPEDDILDTKKMEEIMKANDYSKSEREKTKKKKADFEKELLDLKSNHLNLYSENMQLLVNQQKLEEELCKIKENSGCNNEKTPCGKNPGFKRHKYTESEFILSDDNTQKKNSLHKIGYSRDKISIHEPNEIEEERQSMLSSISRNLNFTRPSSHSPRKNNRNSFSPFFDEKKFCTDPRQKTTICENICHIPQEKVYFSLFCGNGLNNKVQNVGIDFKECQETSFQIKNGNEEKKLNNLNEVVETKEEKKFKKINIKRGKNNKNKERKTTAVNTSKDVISLNKSTTNVSKRNVNKNDLKKIKYPESKVAGKKLGPRTSFNRSITSLSNSVMYVEKMEDKNIISNTFEQKKIKKNLGMPRKNEKKDSKRLSYFGGVKGDVPHNLKKQTEIKNDLLKKKKETTKSSLPQKNNDEAMRKFYAKNCALQQQKKTSGAHQKNQKVPRQQNK